MPARPLFRYLAKETIANEAAMTNLNFGFFFLSSASPMMMEVGRWNT
jgi:hypothetical protein